MNDMNKNENQDGENKNKNNNEATPEYLTHLINVLTKQRDLQVSLSDKFSYTLSISLYELLREYRCADDALGEKKLGGMTFDQQLDIMEKISDFFVKYLLLMNIEFDEDHFKLISNCNYRTYKYLLEKKQELVPYIDFASQFLKRKPDGNK